MLGKISLKTTTTPRTSIIGKYAKYAEVFEHFLRLQLLSINKKQ